jgi:hypothetical protein
MTDATQASLRKLHSLSDELNQVSDSLTSDLNSVETELNKLKLGVPAWVRIHQEDAGDGWIRAYSMGYHKLRGKWGLVIYEYLEGMEEEGDNEVIFLRDAARDVRIHAAEHLDELIDKIAENAAEVTKKIKDKAEQAKGIATALSKGRS